MLKRSFDIIASFFGLIVCLPLLLGIAILIKLDSAGPILFKQLRVGRGFRTFKAYKFRTMLKSASQESGPLLQSDPRITRTGQFLRKYYLDELPQLINILKGDMSLVGPRPQMPSFVEKFHEGYQEILTVRPGLTDLASLKFIREPELLEQAEKPDEEYINNVLPEKIRLGIVYIKHASFPLDVAIFTQTLFNCLGLHIHMVEIPELELKVKKRGSKYPAVARQIIKYRRPLIIIVDLAIISLSNYLSFWIRFDGDIPDQQINTFVQTLPWLIVIRGVAFFFFRLYEGLWRYTSIWDLYKILSGVVSSTIVLYAFIHVVFPIMVYPRSIHIIDSILLIGFLVGIRLPARFIREIRGWQPKKKVLIFGAGDAGERIVREMKSRSSYPYEAIGFIDDDSSLVGQRIHGVKVLGTRKDLTNIMVREEPHEILIAIPRANPATTRQIVTALEAFNLPIKTLPSMRDLLDGNVTINQIRALAIEDLLQRSPIGLDSERVRKLVAGKHVMVTGAGGSIGSELCRQIFALQPSALILYERYENSLYSIGNELARQVGGTLFHLVIGDITDRNRLEEILAKHRPDIIFHAAAHKHVPLMEENPSEAIKNNILGTNILAQAAERFGVEQFVFISTDKAVNPSSVMGATKRVAETIVRGLATHSKTCFSIVRFGNVLGSNGSVVPLFESQIQEGGPVTVTHPEIQRYFMLIPEAVQLVLQAAALGEQGDIFVLDMGEQIKILDLARQVIRLSGYIPEQDIAIAFVGLRPGEKLFEELVGPDEQVEPSPIEKILRVTSKIQHDPVSLAKRLREVEQALSIPNQNGSIIKWLNQLVPNFNQENTKQGNQNILEYGNPESPTGTSKNN